jgi:hypothetical protein
MNRNAWKTQQWSIGEQVGWELWEMSTRQYFRCVLLWLPCNAFTMQFNLRVMPIRYTCSARAARYKWGIPKNGTTDCEVEIENEDGEKVLRQYPFETVMDLLPPQNKPAGAAEAEHARRVL